MALSYSMDRGVRAGVDRLSIQEAHPPVDSTCATRVDLIADSLALPRSRPALSLFHDHLWLLSLDLRLPSEGPLREISSDRRLLLRALHFRVSDPTNLPDAFQPAARSVCHQLSDLARRRDRFMAFHRISQPCLQRQPTQAFLIVVFQNITAHRPVPSPLPLPTASPQPAGATIDQQACVEIFSLSASSSPR